MTISMFLVLLVGCALVYACGYFSGYASGSAKTAREIVSKLDGTD